MSDERIRVALSSARGLARIINSLSESELTQALNLEAATQRRPTHMERMVSRLSALKAVRIKDKLVKEYTPWVINRQ